MAQSVFFELIAEISETTCEFITLTYGDKVFGYSDEIAAVLMAYFELAVVSAIGSIDDTSHELGNPNLMVVANEIFDDEFYGKFEEVIIRFLETELRQEKLSLLLTQTVEKGHSCSICMEDLTPDIGRKTICAHFFCVTCLEKWLIIKNSCPVCRQEIL